MRLILEFDYLPEDEQWKYRPIRDCVDSLVRYVNDRIETGGFLRAVLENDLMGAFTRADLNNQRNMALIASYVYNCIPMGAKGSREAVNNWLRRDDENLDGL